MRGRVALCLIAVTSGCTWGGESASEPVRPAVEAKSSARSSRVYVISARGEPLYKPLSFRTPAGGVMRDIEWLSYGRDPAVGEGTWYGKRMSFQLNTISTCGGKRAYLYVVNGTGKAPPFPVSHCAT